MRRKILVILILGMFLMTTMASTYVSSKKTITTSEIEENVIKQDTSEFKLFPLTDDYLYDLENEIYPGLDLTDSNDDGSLMKTSNLANIKVVFEPPWDNYDNRKHKDKWGISDCWQEDITKNGEYHKTTCHAWAGPGAGYASISVSLMHYDGFSPPKDATYSFKYYMNMKGTIKLESMSGFLGSSAARGGASFYFYFWDGETMSFKKSITFRDHYSIAGVGNGQYPYDKDYTYSNSASLKKGVHYTFGANGKPWIVCDGFIECPAWADHWVTSAGLKKLEIEWQNSAPNKPELSSPSNEATGISTSPTLRWSCSDPDGKYDSLKYDIYLGTSSSPPLVKSGQTSTGYGASSLNPNTKYYWKIKATDSKGSSQTSSVWSFTTKKGYCLPAITKSNIADRTDLKLERLFRNFWEAFPNLLKII